MKIIQNVNSILRENHLIFRGGGGTEVSRRIYFCLFFDFFFNLPELILLNPGGRGFNIHVITLLLQETFFQRAKYFHFIMRKVIYKVFEVSKSVYGVRNEYFGLRKQISDYERRILECENRFWSAKALP